MIIHHSWKLFVEFPLMRLLRHLPVQNCAGCWAAAWKPAPSGCDATWGRLAGLLKYRWRWLRISDPGTASAIALDNRLWLPLQKPLPRARQSAASKEAILQDRCNVCKGYSKVWEGSLWKIMILACTIWTFSVNAQSLVCCDWIRWQTLHCCLLLVPPNRKV